MTTTVTTATAATTTATTAATTAATTTAATATAAKKTYSITTNAITHNLYSMFRGTTDEKALKVRDKALHLNYALFYFAHKNGMEYFLDRFGRLERLTTVEGKFQNVTEKVAKEAREVTSVIHAEDLSSELVMVVCDELDGFHAMAEYLNQELRYNAGKMTVKQEEKFIALREQFHGNHADLVNCISFRRSLRRIWKYIRDDYNEGYKYSRFSELEAFYGDTVSMADILADYSTSAECCNPEEDLLYHIMVDKAFQGVLTAAKKHVDKEGNVNDVHRKIAEVERNITFTMEQRERAIAVLETNFTPENKKKVRVLEDGIKVLKNRLKGYINTLYVRSCAEYKTFVINEERLQIASGASAIQLKKENYRISASIAKRRQEIRRLEAIAYN